MSRSKELRILSVFTPHTAAFSSTWIFLDFASILSAILSLSQPVFAAVILLDFGVVHGCVSS